MNISSVSSIAVSQAAKPAESSGFLDGIGSFFGEILDIVNPLQHIPLVSSLYRNLTGDAMSPVANIVGGTLFGGPLGGGLAAASEMAKAALGEASSEQTALVDNSNNPSALEMANIEKYTKTMRVTTQDWLNADFGKSIVA